MSGFVARFQQVAAATPRAIAIETPDEAVTYAQLLVRANAIAERLRAELGSADEPIVALAMPKSVEFVAAMLGCWIAGAAWMPLSPVLPAERQAFLLRDSGASAILTAGAAHLAAPPGVRTPDVRDAGSLPVPANAPADYDADRLAYLIYTSGSTGDPKGVLVTHAGLLPLLKAQIDAFEIGPGSRSLWLLSEQFDASVSDLGVALLSGGTVIIDLRAAGAAPAALLRLLQERAITHLDLPPALLPLLHPEQAPSCLRTLIIGGEPAPAEAVRRWARNRRVVNVYGPTEATVCTSLCCCDPEEWERPLIGDPIAGIRYEVRPLANTEAATNQAAPGEEGELWIGGPGLARGYLHRPELTAARFVVQQGRRYYRTGDRVVRHTDGTIEFLGRLDRQVKVRGMLVAPEEVEARLAAHPDVARAAVLQRRLTHSARDLLVAFVAPRNPCRPTTQALRAYLAGCLPEWMVPRRFELLDSLPLTASGKPDLAELAILPLGVPEVTNEAVTAPLDREELVLLRIWESVLGLSEIPASSGFMDLGGDSFAALAAAARAEQAGFSISAAALQANASIRDLLGSAGFGGRRLEDGLEASSANGMLCAALRRRIEIDPELREIAAGVKSRTGAEWEPEAASETPRRILLTGATGFLGGRVLLELLRHTNAEIQCLVRAPGPDPVAAGMQRLVRAATRAGEPLSNSFAKRVAAVPGDVEQRHLGLPERQWRRLAAAVDTVFHCAAVVNMLRDYAALEPVNVWGTRELLRLLAEGRPKRLHYASTLSVFVASDRNRGRVFEDDDLRDHHEVFGGYAQTKWAAEWMVRGTGPKLGSGTIHRFGLLVEADDRNPAPLADHFSLFIQGLAELGSYPEQSGGDDEPEVDLTPVDYAAAAMVRLSLQDRSEGFCTYHLANPRSTRLGELTTAIRACGVPLRALPVGDWLDRIGAASPRSAAAALALSRCFSGLSGSAAHRTVDLFQATGVTFDMTRAVGDLQGTGLSCPVPEPALVERCVRAALRRNTAKERQW